MASSRRSKRQPCNALSVPFNLWRFKPKEQAECLLDNQHQKIIVLTSDKQLEIARLKREVAKLKAERDILNKAAAYFAGEST
jgi:transposase